MKNIVILTGSGISQESGIDTFRDQGGLWEKHSIEEVATPEAFENNPKKVQKFYNKRRAQLKKVKPNKAHFALAELEQKWEGDFTLITQNVDDLHLRAGNQNVLPMHGQLNQVRCTHTHEILTWNKDLSHKTASPFHEQGRLRPHVVWFGELPLYMDVIFQKLDQADMFVSIGTSGSVYPAGGFAHHMQMKGCEDLIEVNTENSTISHLFTKRFVGKATEKVPELVDYLLSI